MQLNRTKCLVRASSLVCTIIVSMEQSCILWHTEWVMLATGYKTGRIG